MRVHSRVTKSTCGIDLHARTMYVCVLDREGKAVLAPQPALPARSLPRGGRAVALLDLIDGRECLFAWDWLADLCETEGIGVRPRPRLACARSMACKPTATADPWKIVSSCVAESFPSPTSTREDFRATRDLLRRRLHFVRFRPELLTDLKMSEAQANLERLEEATGSRAESRRLRRALSRRPRAAPHRCRLPLSTSSTTWLGDLEREPSPCKGDDLAAFDRLRRCPASARFWDDHLRPGPRLRSLRHRAAFASYSRLIAPRTELCR